ncbi:DUF3189 family protein [Proteinivorax hydrogeniformans]|uniref:DUF3189 family protein n=1 Tax=Proteinivorax hydrogeniformans TaxID=1826727 RepID=A0AAU8HWU9_9FIRM
MKIFYYCYGGAHSSVVAAAIHLEKVFPPLTYEKVKQLPYFDLTSPKNRGVPIKLGEDCDKNEIYFVGFGKDKQLIVKFVESFLNAHGVEDDRYIMVDCLASISFYVKIGGFISKVLNLRKLGQMITAKGIVDSEKSLLKAVDVAKQVSEGKSDILTKI